MGSVESGSKKRRRRENIQGTVLGLVAVTGFITVAAVTPGVLHALPHVIGKERYRLAFRTKTALDRLVVKGYLRRIRKHGKSYLEITAVGSRTLALQLAQAEKVAQRKRRWDGDYRLITFDIPQRKRRVRDRLGQLMGKIGFLRIQDSVWISPYDCEDLVALIKVELHLRQEVIYAVVRQLDNDKAIREHFGLPCK